MLYNYKTENGGDLRVKVQLLLGAGWLIHRQCLELGHEPIDGYAVVPTTSGRRAHPLPGLVKPLMDGLEQISVTSKGTTKTRTVDPAKFVIPSPEHLATLRHVLVVDDTWTTGATVQSLAWGLKQHGVARVTAMVAARWLKPTWSATAAFLSQPQHPLDVSRCLVTGATCP